MNVSWEQAKLVAVIILSNLFIVLIFWGLWSIDLSTSGLILQEQYNLDLEVVGLFGTRDLITHYHYGLGSVIMGSLGLIILIAVSSIWWRK